jgi:hypothetical protein
MDIEAFWLAVQKRISRFKKPAREFFHWKYSSNFIFFFWGAVMACVSIATFFSDASFFFNWAYFFCFCGLIWSLCFWLTSDFLEQKRIKTRRQIRGLDPYSTRPHRIWQVAGGLAILAVFGGSLLFVRGAQIRKRLQSFGDILVAANLPTPPNVCTSFTESLVGPHPLLVLLGPMAAISSMPHQNVIVIGGEKVLTMDRDSKGQVTISTDIYDANHDIVAELNKNNYDVDSSVYKLERKDLSDLRVIVRHDKEEVLHVEYLNPETISITGVFRTKTDVLQVNASNAYLNGEPLPFHGVCSGNSGAADFYFETGRNRQP